MTRLILIRHGETDWNVEGRWQGQADVPLNQTGRQQAQDLAQALSNADISAIYSSDLGRTVETALALSNCLELPIRRDPRLREIHQGEWQGLLVGEIETRYTELFQQRMINPLDIAPPGGETVVQVKERVVNAITDILRAHPQDTVAVVSHGFALAILRVHFENKPIDQVWHMLPEPGNWFELEIDSRLHY